MDWLDAKTIYTISHIFGAIIGAGGAYMSDAMFFASIKDEIISKIELKFMKIGSAFVWTGLAILLVSGLLLFSTDPSVYLASSKFQIKMFIVFVIFMNGLVFHMVHLPRIHRHADHHYPSSDEFTRKSKFLIASGVVSVTSWTFVIVLGGLRTIPIDFTTVFTGYILFEVVFVYLALIFAKKLL